MRKLDSISLVIPVYNEEQVIPTLVSRLHEVLDGISIKKEIIFVNDGSDDATLDLLSQVSFPGNDTVILSFSRNFGHQLAITAGIDRAGGDAIIIMDADLQDPPEIIPTFIGQFQNGYDVVYGERAQRKAVWYLRFLYRSFYKIISWLSDLNLPQNAGDFSLISRRVADVIRNSPEQYRYVRGLRFWAGFRQIGGPIIRPERDLGTTKYSFRKLLGLATAGIFSFSDLPLRLSSLLGFTTIGVSMLFLVYSLWAKFSGNSPQGFTATIAIIIFMGGIQLLTIGIVGEYIGRIYHEVKKRPLYVISDEIKK